MEPGIEGESAVAGAVHARLRPVKIRLEVAEWTGRVAWDGNGGIGRLKAQCRVLQRTQRARRAIEPERFAMWARKRAGFIGGWRGRELPAGVPQIVGRVHSRNPGRGGLVAHRAAWVDARLRARTVA